MSSSCPLVSHAVYITRCVSVVGADGQVIHSCEKSQTSDVGQMEYPVSLAVTKNDDILVTDRPNNRILSINRSTGYVYKSWLCWLTVEYNNFNF